jgi:hypothetical protein
VLGDQDLVQRLLEELHLCFDTSTEAARNRVIVDAVVREDLTERIPVTLVDGVAVADQQLVDFARSDSSSIDSGTATPPSWQRLTNPQQRMPQDRRWLHPRTFAWRQ